MSARLVFDRAISPALLFLCCGVELGFYAAEVLLAPSGILVFFLTYSRLPKENGQASSELLSPFFGSAEFQEIHFLEFIRSNV